MPSAPDHHDGTSARLRLTALSAANLAVVLVYVGLPLSLILREHGVALGATIVAVLILLAAGSAFVLTILTRTMTAPPAHRLTAGELIGAASPATRTSHAQGWVPSADAAPEADCDRRELSLA